MEEAYIYDTVRSPRGKGKGGSLNELTAVALSAKILRELRSRNDLNTEEVEDVIWGNVTQVGEQGGCLARSAVIAADYSETTPWSIYKQILCEWTRSCKPSNKSSKRFCWQCLCCWGSGNDEPCANGVRWCCHCS